ncbi:hypothetical protein CspHIS471_0701430 [Cutaneotrichosporon sp. HIS471]|nr:hypothetical protein CspHIS471_0701430 [Cutaneotrichosporon sp. HIS471]
MSQGHRPPSSATTPHAPIAPVAPAAVHQLATPTPFLVDSSLPAYLLPAALSALADSAAAAVRRRIAAETEAEGESSSMLDVGNKGKEKAADMPLLVDAAVATRVERIGYMVGGYIAEKLMAARPPLATHLDMIKFVCKDLFLYIYGKQIDNLRTNHRGVFVLQSHAFPPLESLSSFRGAAADLDAARHHLVFPQALIQGALARLGMHTTVTCESSQLPQCTFQIRTVKNTTSRKDSAGAASILGPMSPPAR